MSASEDLSITVKRGDTPRFNFEVLQSDGSPFDLTGAKLIFSVKRNTDDTTYTFQRKNVAAGGDASQIEDVDLANGQFQVKLIATNTSTLTTTTFVYDVQATIGASIITLVIDKFKVVKDVTR